MRHTFVAWDCSFRNFHHLVKALAEQDYPKDQYELIVVEQRNRKMSDSFNHTLGLASLQDTVDSYSKHFDVKAVFLDQDESHPYHLSVSNNVGIRMARGTCISVMDADQLLRSDFLSSLDTAHEQLGTIINLHRRYAVRPAGASPEDWVRGIVDFDTCLAECPDSDKSIPRKTSDKGPMISAPREWWEAVGGYDEHRIFSTGVSRAGQDVTAHMEILTGRESLALPGQFSVHPYHPAGFSRSGSLEYLILWLQERLISWAVRNREASQSARRPMADQLYANWKDEIEANISGTWRNVSRSRLALLTAGLKLLSLPGRVLRRLRCRR